MLKFIRRSLYIRADGRVVYTGGLGLFGFKPDELEAAIETYM